MDGTSSVGDGRSRSSGYYRPSQVMTVLDAGGLGSLGTSRSRGSEEGYERVSGARASRTARNILDSSRRELGTMQ